MEPQLVECYVCRRQIRAGEPYVSVDYHIERIERSGTIQVERAESLLTACIDCAPSRTALAATLRGAGYPVPQDPDEPLNGEG